ncbi:uncharacterized protein LOC117793608 isoform X2 [Drosophila innubila]|uniref:uncharacterized protein LOC117793608 isoform X2 n=1 Tax=Drosophila innubila TaxID=198719 RepID=UPI00148CD6AA|nr:uncharacterized protein LOC117793608 isoform X2 [Drosophila innubila]
MSLFKNMFNGNRKHSPVREDIPKDLDGDMQTSDIFESGHRLTALENIGSSLTTLWSNCALNVISSRENIDKEINQNKPNTAKDISGTTNVDSTSSESS